MTQLRKASIWIVLALLPAGCVSNGPHPSDDPCPLPNHKGALASVASPGFSTVDPRGNAQDQQPPTPNQTQPAGNNGNGTQQVAHVADDLPHPAPAGPAASQEVTTRSLAGPPNLPALSGPAGTRSSIAQPPPFGPSDKLPAPGSFLGGPLASSPPPNPLASDDRAASFGREPLEVALGYLLADRHDAFLEELKKYRDPATRSLFERVLEPLAWLTHKKLADLSPAEATRIYAPLKDVVDELQPRARISIEAYCFCDWVNSFGDYQPCAADHVFQASTAARSGERVQLYVEVRNFANVKRDGFYETQLASSVEIAEVRNGQKKTVWSHAFNEKRHRSRSLRHDHFNNYSFNVPPMPPGEYLLTITIADETIPEARREPASKSLTFRVGTRQ